MKKMMRFAAMAATMIALCVSCEEIKNEGLEDDKNNNENVDGGGSEEDVTPVSIDGKQWSFTWAAMNVAAVLDLGVTAEGTLVFGVDAAAMDPSLAGSFVAYGGGTYTVTPTDATSGVITMADPMGGGDVVFNYSDLTENSVKLTNAVPYQLENCEATLLTDKVTILQ